MTKEQIFSTLMGKVGKTSLSERTINDYIGKMMPTEGDPDDAWFNTHSEILKSLNGNFSADVANQVNEFKKNYKPEPTPNPTPNPNPDPTPQPNAEVEELKQQMTALMEQMKGVRAKNYQDSIRNSALAKADELYANKGLWQMAVSQTTVEENVSPEDFLTKVKETYETMNKNVFGNSAAPYGNNRNPEEESKQEIDDFFASKGGPWAK